MSVDTSLWRISTYGVGPGPDALVLPDPERTRRALEIMRAMRDDLVPCDPDDADWATTHMCGDHEIALMPRSFGGPTIVFRKGSLHLGRVQLEDPIDGVDLTDAAAVNVFLRTTARWLTDMCQVALERPFPIGGVDEDDPSSDPRIAPLRRVGMVVAALSGHTTERIYVSAPSPWSPLRMHDSSGRFLPIDPRAAALAARLLPVCANLKDTGDPSEDRFDLMPRDLQWSVDPIDMVEVMRIAGEIAR